MYSLNVKRDELAEGSQSASHSPRNRRNACDYRVSCRRCQFAFPRNPSSHRQTAGAPTIATVALLEHRNVRHLRWLAVLPRKVEDSLEGNAGRSSQQRIVTIQDTSRGSDLI